MLCLLQVVAYDSNGSPSPVSAPDQFTTSPDPAPTLTNVQATSPTTGTATAVPPPGVTYTGYTFTVVPLNGGPAITVPSSSVTAPIPGLTPGTQARSIVCQCLWCGICYSLHVQWTLLAEYCGVACMLLQYQVTVTGTLPGGQKSLPSAALIMTTPLPG